MLKIEGGTVFIDKDTMITNTRIYNSTVVCVVPKGAEWSEAFIKEWLDKHTNGDVTISNVRMLNQHSYADEQKEKAENERKMHEAFEKLKSNIEGMITRKPTLFQRVTNKFKREKA